MRRPAAACGLCRLTPLADHDSCLHQPRESLPNGRRRHAQGLAEFSNPEGHIPAEQLDNRFVRAVQGGL